MDAKPTFILHLRPSPHDDEKATYRKLKALLKRLWRNDGWKCISVTANGTTITRDKIANIPKETP